MIISHVVTVGQVLEKIEEMLSTPTKVDFTLGTGV